jgi:protein-L-isoaspartate(D-aspartate) O-methyltransferase
MAALLAHKARHVTTVEIQPEAAKLARENLAKAGVDNVTVEEGNGAAGWEKGAPYDVIVVSGALPVLPEALVKQVKVGGRLAVILGEAPAMSFNIVTRTSETAVDTVKIFETIAKPLTGAQAPSRFQF